LFATGKSEAIGLLRFRQTDVDPDMKHVFINDTGELFFCYSSPEDMPSTDWQIIARSG